MRSPDTRIECINGLDYDKVMFRNELVLLIRQETSSRVDYIRSIERPHPYNGYYEICYVADGKEVRYSTIFSTVARKISEFTKLEDRNNKLIQLGI